MYLNAYIKIHQEFDHLLSSQLGITRYLSEHHSYNEAIHKICLYFNEGYILNDNKIKCIVALKQENKYILCRDIVIRLSPLLFRDILIRDTHIGISGYPKISNLIELINSKPIFEFNRITIKDVPVRRLYDYKLDKRDFITFQFTHSKLNQFNVIEDLGELAFDFESIYAVKSLPHHINLQNTEYTLVGKNFYAPYANTVDCHCILFAQEFNIHDEYAIEVKKWFPNSSSLHQHDGIYKCGYISRDENQTLHDLMLQNHCQVLFGIIKNNRISITGGVELLKDEDSNSSACSKYLKHLCREEYFYPSYAPTGEYKPYNESIDIQFNGDYISALLLSKKYLGTTNSTPKELYELQCKLERYHKSFDEMCSYIETYSSSINKYKEHTKQPSISTFELIRLIIDKDEILCRYIDEEIELNRLKDSVKAIDSDYHLGYREFIRIRGYRLYDLNAVQMKDICNNMCYIQSLDSEQKAIQLSNKYPDAFKIIYSCCSTINATIARDICRNEGKLRTLQERLNEVETIKRKAQKNTAYDSYIDGIPLYFFYWYYKKSFTDISEESEYARQMIYSFKDGRSHFTPQKLICEKLSGIYNESELKQLTFACVPASMLMDNYKRLHSFYNDVCETLGMKNGFEHIHNTKSGTPSHRGGTGIEDIEVDTNFFKDALVVVFDDITTKGRSMRLLIRKLKEAGATVIYCLALGKTYSDYYGEARKPHPHTGNI